MPESKDIRKYKPKMKGMRPGGHGGPMGARLMAEKPKNAKGTLKRLLKYLGKSKLLLYTLSVIILLVTGLSLAGPSLLAKVIDIISIDIKDKSAHVDFNRLYPLIIALSFVYLASAGLSYAQGLLAAKLSLYTIKTFRGDLFEKIEYLPLKYIDTHHHGDIMSRMTNDIENVSNTISSSVSSLFSGILSLIGTLVIMLWYSPVLTLISLLTVPLTVLFGTGIARSLKKLFFRQQSLIGSLNGQIEEMVTGHKTVIAFGYEKRAISDFSETSTRLKKTSISAQILAGMMGPIMNLIGNLSFLIIASAGGYMAYKGIITVGVIQAFIIYARQLNRPINELSNQYAQIQTALAGAERVFSIMDEPSEPNEGMFIPAPEDIKGEIELRNVVFSYKESEPVLRSVSMHVKPGQKIAIVGATGAGKTTIVNLLTRFYDIESGEILLDGVDIRQYDKKALRRNIAIVLQDTVLFFETIGYNIRYGRLDATDSEMRAAAEAANASAFIERLPIGYETPLSETGGNLSGGQRQLLSIARAVLADPKILILDEATSSVDTRTEMRIQEAMISLMKNRTSLIIAHRLSTIRDADKIVVIEDGVVAESGSHNELIANKGAYYRLYQKQYAGIAT